jgi:hypothetical protein
LGIGDWGLGPIPNPQSPIPNPQSPIPNPHLNLKIFLKSSNFNKLLNYHKKNILYSLSKIIKRNN